MSSLFLTLTHYSIDKVNALYFIPNGGNTGIGNMLFQISSTIIYSIKNNAQLYVPGLSFFFEIENLNKEDTIFRNINNECTPEYIAIKDTAISSENNRQNIWDYTFVDNMNFCQFMENYRNFDEHKDIILNLFRPIETDKSYIFEKYPIIKNDNICSIHIRLGPDYTRIFDYNILNNLQESYFNSIDHMMREKHISVFFVFTNDREYCISILNNNPKYSNISFIYSDERDFIDIWMISLIKNNIVSVSTLAWWGSYLNEHTDKYIICSNSIRNDLHYPGWVII